MDDRDDRVDRGEFIPKMGLLMPISPREFAWTNERTKSFARIYTKLVVNARRAYRQMIHTRPYTGVCVWRGVGGWEWVIGSFLPRVPFVWQETYRFCSFQVTSKLFLRGLRIYIYILVNFDQQTKNILR